MPKDGESAGLYRPPTQEDMKWATAFMSAKVAKEMSAKVVEEKVAKEKRAVEAKKAAQRCQRSDKGQKRAAKDSGKKATIIACCCVRNSAAKLSTIKSKATIKILNWDVVAVAWEPRKN